MYTCFKLFVFVCFLYFCQCLHLPVESLTSNSEQNDKQINLKILNSEIKLPKNGELFEGDIYMDNRLRREIQGDTKRSAVTSLRKWPNSVIPYKIDSTFTKKNRQHLREAMNEYKMRTCIRFKKRTNETDYVIFTAKNKGCASFVGRRGGPQHINLEKRCGVVGTYEHEIMHALGFIHEQSRPDRDNYINIHVENIHKDAINNFYKYRFVNNLNEEFNFASIMLYRNDAFTKNGKPTLSAVGDRSLIFGQRARFSIGDVVQINRLYNCKERLEKPFYAGLFGEYSGSKDRKKVATENVFKAMENAIFGK